MFALFNQSDSHEDIERESWWRTRRNTRAAWTRPAGGNTTSVCGSRVGTLPGQMGHSGSAYLKATGLGVARGWSQNVGSQWRAIAGGSTTCFQSISLIHSILFRPSECSMKGETRRGVAQELLFAGFVYARTRRKGKLWA